MPKGRPTGVCWIGFGWGARAGSGWFGLATKTRGSEAKDVQQWVTWASLICFDVLHVPTVLLVGKLLTVEGAKANKVGYDGSPVARPCKIRFMLSLPPPPPFRVLISCQKPA